MKRICLISAICLIGLMTACGGAGNIGRTGTTSNSTSASSTGSGSNPGSGSKTASSDCGIWGGNTDAAPSSGTSAFQPAGTMNCPRAGHSATLLPDGTVLIIGGGQLDIDDLLVSIPSAEIFDPSQDKFSSVGNVVSRERHTATVLRNGKVLIAGGNQFSGYPTWLPATAAADLYDPATRSFTSTGSMQAARTRHTATLLADGRVLIAGGSTSVDALASTEIYDPATGLFVAAATMASPRIGHTATILLSGKVLIVGGEDGKGALASAELYEPVMNTLSSTGSMTTPRSGHTATLLANGKVLIAGGVSSLQGGNDGVILPVTPLLASAELYDPATGTFSPAATMTTGRLAHQATLLPNGKVLITGGYVDNGPGGMNWAGYKSLASAEIYDPMSASFTATDPMNVTRFWHSATLLRDGSVLVAGGIGADWTLASAEIYKP